MKNQHFDDLIENLHDLKFKSEKDIYLFMLKYGKNKYVQVNKMTPIVGRPPLTREEILKDNPLILNIKPDVNELVSEKIREIAIMGNGRVYLENVKKVFKEYDFHIPLPMKNFYIEFPRNGFGISKIELSNASKDELGSFDLLAIYLKVTYIDGKIKYNFFLQTKTYLNDNFQSKILNHISYNEKEFIQQITNDTTPIFHLITYALSKGITDCYLAGVRQDRDITIKNEHGNKVKLKYPSSVIVYNHKQYEPNPESNVIVDYFGEGRNVIGHYRHYYLKDAYKQRIIGTDGYWILDITKPEEGGKNEFGDRPGTDFLKGRTYVNAQLKSKEHQTFITKYIKLSSEEDDMRHIKRNPDKLSNKELIAILEPLILNVIMSSNLFLGIENAKLKKKFNALYEIYTITIKFYPSEERDWTIDPELNKRLSLYLKDTRKILNSVYDNLTSYFSEEKGLDDSDSAAAATARFLEINVDPLSMTVRGKR
jgi:hypothetical protein